MQSGREEQSCQALGYCTLNSEYTVAGVLEVTPHAHLHGGTIYGRSPHKWNEGRSGISVSAITVFYRLFLLVLC